MKRIFHVLCATLCLSGCELDPELVDWIVDQHNPDEGGESSSTSTTFVSTVSTGFPGCFGEEVGGIEGNECQFMESCEGEEFAIECEGDTCQCFYNGEAAGVCPLTNQCDAPWGGFDPWHPDIVDCCGWGGSTTSSTSIGSVDTSTTSSSGPECLGGGEVGGSDEDCFFVQACGAEEYGVQCAEGDCECVIDGNVVGHCPMTLHCEIGSQGFDPFDPIFADCCGWS